MQVADVVVTQMLVLVGAGAHLTARPVRRKLGAADGQLTDERANMRVVGEGCRADAQVADDAAGRAVPVGVEPSRSRVVKHHPGQVSNRSNPWWSAWASGLVASTSSAGPVNVAGAQTLSVRKSSRTAPTSLEERTVAARGAG